MKPIYLYTLFLLTLVGCSQKGPIGLYNSCDEFGTHMCWQLKIKKDSTFTLYDKLQMREWYIINGQWKKNGDTLSLTSHNQPYHLDRSETSENDSITIIASLYEMKITRFYLNIDTVRHEINDTLILTIHKQDLKSPTLRVWLNENEDAILPIEELICNDLCDTATIRVNAFIGQWVYLDNTRYVYSDNQLFPVDSLGHTNDSIFIPKVSSRKFKYQKKYGGTVLK